MKLKFSDGGQLRLGSHNEFKIKTGHHEACLMIKATAVSEYQPISWHYGKADARRKLIEILEALNRGEKVFEV